MAKDTAAEGYIDIKLTRPIQISGAATTTVRMREPLVRDQLAADQSASGAAEQEITMMANLCEIAPKDIEAMSLRDYAKLQKAFRSFID